MSEYVIQGQTLTGIADAIRAQLGTGQQYTPESMAAAIGSIQGAGTELADKILDGTVDRINDGKLQNIRNHLFEGTLLRHAVFNSVLSSGTSAFQNCKQLEYIHVPLLLTIAQNLFYGCEKLLIFRTSANYISSNAFSRSGIQHLILDYNEVATLQSPSAIINTPIAIGTGYIYVADNLVDQYKVATNWITYADQIKGLSEIPEEVQEWLSSQNP